MTPVSQDLNTAKVPKLNGTDNAAFSGRMTNKKEKKRTELEKISHDSVAGVDEM